MQKSAYKILDNAMFLDRSFSRDYILTIHDLPSEEKPRQKLMSQGPQSLTMRELLAVALNTGSTKEDVIEMSNRIMKEYGEKTILSETDPEHLSSDLDIPIGKACIIVAVGEIVRRQTDKSQAGFVNIRNAQDVFDYLQDMRNLPKEHLRGLFLNSHSRIIRDEVISIGTVNSNIIHPREVFRAGIECNAAAVVLAHNHPSGEVTPSSEDIEITNQLVQAGKILGITVLDHVIITKDKFISIINN
ncbi:MAG: DNA repair protein RadC [Candidatus Taylorbacteria bacterium]